MQKSERDKAKWKILMHRVETRDHCKRNISRLMLSLIVVKKTRNRLNRLDLSDLSRYQTVVFFSLFEISELSSGETV